MVKSRLMQPAFNGCSTFYVNESEKKLKTSVSRSILKLRKTARLPQLFSNVVYSKIRFFIEIGFFTVLLQLFLTIYHAFPSFVYMYA